MNHLFLLKIRSPFCIFIFYLLSCVVLGGSDGVSPPSHGNCGQEKSELREDMVPISEAVDLAKSYAEIIAKEIEEEFSNIEIDTTNLVNFLLSAPHGLSGKPLSDWIAEVVNNYKIKATELISELGKDTLIKFIEKHTEVSENFSPHAKLWSTNLWETGCCSAGEWTRGRGKLLGMEEFKVEVSVEVSDEAKSLFGVAVNDSLTAPIVLGCSATLMVQIKDLKPIEPRTTTEGPTIVIKATPNGRITAEVSTIGDAFIITKGGFSVAENVELKKIETTLRCSE